MKRLVRICALALSLAALLVGSWTPVALTAAERQPTIKHRGPSKPPANSVDPGPWTVVGSGPWFVELSSPPIAEIDPTLDAATYGSTLQGEKQAFRDAARDAGIRFRERRAFDMLWNGLTIDVDAKYLLALSRLPQVVALYPVGTIEAPGPAVALEPPPASPELYTAITMTHADQAQAAGWTGRGIKVAIMDTGIDYNHPDLGGGFGPGHRVVGGYDFVGNEYTGGDEKILPDEDPMDCGGHGTHVAGILAGNGGIRGVAPEAELRAYKVFGCSGTTTSDIMLEAMERVLADGNQVLNMSIGAAYQWPQYPTARASNNLVNRGVVVVTSAGNSGGNGLYSISAPGAGQKVIASASVDNARVHSPAFEFNGTLYGYQQMAFANAPPTAGTEGVVSVGLACNANLPLNPAVSGKVALAERGTCSFREKAINAANAGATNVLIFNSASGLFLGTLGEPALPIRVASMAREDGLAIRAALPGDLTWTAQFTETVNSTGGLVSTFTSIGVAPDLSLKPDASAPGGLIFSTIPLAQGGYGLNSGTSMASPHIAGAAALVLQARPGTSSQEMREIISNSGAPGRWFGNPNLGLLESAHRGGSGLIDIPAAINGTTRVSPAKLGLGETEGLPVTRSLQIRNNGASEVTYDLTHRAGVATGANTFTVGFFDQRATVAFSAASLTVPAGGSAGVDVTFTEPAGLASRGIFNGYIVVTPQGGGRAINVPYAGFKGDYQTIRVLNPAASSSGNPLLRATPTVGPSAPRTIHPADDEQVFVLVHLDHAVRKLRLDLYEAGGRHVVRLGDFPFVGRNATATEFFDLAWDGMIGPETQAPAGNYILRVSAHKALGDSDNPAHIETWDSPVVSVAD